MAEARLVELLGQVQGTGQVDKNGVLPEGVMEGIMEGAMEGIMEGIMHTCMHAAKRKGVLPEDVMADTGYMACCLMT